MKRRYAIAAAILALALVGLVALFTLQGGAPPGDKKVGGPAGETTIPLDDPERPDTTREPPPPPIADLGRVELSPAEVSVDPDLAAGAFEGVVVNWGTNRPVPGAELTFTHEGATLSARADDTGRFRLLPPELGLYRLAVVSADGFLPYAPELGRSPIVLVARARMKVSGVQIFLSPAIDYTGIVVDAGGRPVAGAEVTRVGAGSTDALIPIDSEFVSGADGTFSFHAFDNTVFEARHREAGFGRAALGPASQISRRMEIRLSADRSPPSGVIRGVVVDKSGEPVSDALVRAQVADDRREPGGDVDPIYEVTSGDDGRFELSGLETRAYELVAAAEGYGRRELGASATTAKRARAVRVVLPAGHVIRGSVTDVEGSPVASFSVIASRVTGPLARGPGRSVAVLDSDGAFEITGLDADTYAVVATASGHAPSREVEASASPAADARPITVTLSRAGALTGVVIDAESRAPLDSARVTVESRIGIGATATPSITSAVTGSDGRFRLPGLAPKKTSVNVAAHGHHARIVTGLDIVAGADVGPIDIALEPAAEGEAPKTEFAGIGCAIGPADDGFRVSRVFPGSGCAEAGLEIDDVIVAVEGVAVIELGFESALEQLRGPAGTQVTVSLRRAEDPTRDVVITRRKITL